MLYRRNRYFSPTGGQFTQADPIGIAGGMNAFGFAGGDPVNFSDPFGLCPLERDGVPCTLTMAGRAALGGAAGGALFGVTGGTVVLPGVGTLAGAGGGALGGALAGFTAGAVVGAASDVSSVLEMSGFTEKVGRRIQRAIETAGLVIGLLTGNQPPKKPDDEHNPPPPAPTSTKSLVPDEDKDNRTR